MSGVVKRLLQQGGFARATLTLMMGTTVAQAIPIAISPLLTRLYSPADFGMFALFMALLVFLSAAATGRYELAVMLPEREEDADALVILSIAVAAGLGVLLFVLVVIARNSVANMLGEPKIAPWLFLMPVAVFAMGSYNALNYWLNRHGHYRRMGVNRVVQSGLGGGLQLSLGAVGGGAGGLILGQLAGLVATTAQIAVSFSRSLQSCDTQDMRERMKRLALRYLNHPKHLLPAHWVGAAAMQLPILTISILYGVATAGLYALAYRIMVLPSALIANAIGDVYRQKASVLYRQRGEFRRLFLITLATSAALAAVPVGVIFVVAPDLFALVFGESWRVAGEYARVLAVAAFFQFVFTPIDKGALIVGATRYIMIWHVVRLVSFASVLLAGWVFSLSVEMTLMLFVLANTAFYILDGIVGYRLAGSSVGHSKWLV